MIKNDDKDEKTYFIMEENCENDWESYDDEIKKGIEHWSKEEIAELNGFRIIK